MTAYNVMLVLSSKVNLSEWIAFAARLLPADGQLYVRALVTVEAGKSLSEGALVVREWRDAFRLHALAHREIHDEVQVVVEHQPFQLIIQEIRDREINLLVAEWNPANSGVGGVLVDDLLALSRCDIVLVAGIQQLLGESNQVLLSLRGGPNLSIGTQVATAIAGQGSVTLFHAVDNRRTAPDLESIMRTVPKINRTVSAVAGITEGIVRESAVHDIIVMGMGLQQFRQGKSTSRTVFQQVLERSHKPIVLVRAAQQETWDFHPPHFFSKPDDSLSTRVDRWFAQNTFHSSEFDDIHRLLALKEKQGLTISVALPTLNEGATIENVIKTIKTPLMDDLPLIDEIVLIDSRSTDRTVEIAQSCGIPTYTHQEILADEVGTYSGKGEALWKSLYVTHGDIIVWVDTDITNIHPRFIYGLLGPLLKYPRLQYVKGFYTRPLEVGGKLQAYGGGRVTELVARPLLNLFYPELSGIIQPLSGEYAGRRQALEQLPFFSGYGVETGMLIDLLDRFTLDNIAQCDLETRIHHNQPLVNLSKMSFAILQVFFTRLESRYGSEFLSPANRSMKLIVQEADRFALDIAEIGDYERPPMLNIPPYQQKAK